MTTAAEVVWSAILGGLFGTGIVLAVITALAIIVTLIHNPKDSSNDDLF
jgi:uncharacterized membrane protein